MQGVNYRGNCTEGGWVCGNSLHSPQLFSKPKTTLKNNSCYHKMSKVSKKYHNKLYVYICIKYLSICLYTHSDKITLHLFLFMIIFQS